MATIDRVVQMQQQGMPDSEIIKNLKNEGVSPKEISDSLAQAKIKMAVNQAPMESSEYQESYSSNQTGAPEVQENVSSVQQQYQQDPGQTQQQYAPYAETPQAYSGDQGYYSADQGSVNIDTISEIVDRLLTEKLKQLNEKLIPALEFKTRADEEMRDIKERLKRIETTMDTLQRSIINKVGEFGQSTALIHKDLDNLHNTVGKLMNPLVDNYNEMKKFNSKNK